MPHNPEHLTPKELTLLAFTSGGIAGIAFSLTALASHPYSVNEWCACGIETAHDVTLPLLVGLGVYGLTRAQIQRYKTRNIDDNSPRDER